MGKHRHATPAVPYTMAVVTAPHGSIVSIIRCAHCGEEHELYLDVDMMEALQLIGQAIGYTAAPVARALMHVRAAQDRVLADVAPIVSLTVWLLTHTTTHDETMRREVTRG